MDTEDRQCIRQTLLSTKPLELLHPVLFPEFHLTQADPKIDSGKAGVGCSLKMFTLALTTESCITTSINVCKRGASVLRMIECKDDLGITMQMVLHFVLQRCRKEGLSEATIYFTLSSHSNLLFFSYSSLHA